MADSAAFGCLCEHLEASTSFDRLEARGTVRLTLKQAGLSPGDVTPEQLCVVVDKLLAEELVARGIDDADAVCSDALVTLSRLGPAESVDDPESVFTRLGGD